MSKRVARKSNLEKKIDKAIEQDPYLMHVRKFNEDSFAFEHKVETVIEILEDKKLRQQLTTEQRRELRSIAEYRTLKQPDRPTKSVPGSVQRLNAYRARIARGESIFHPEDTNLEDVKGGTIDRVVYSGFNNRHGIRMGY